MSVPGFSVSDLIQALYHAKLVYDAFFDEYSNSASEVRDLAEEIDQFRKNLVQHQETFDARGVKVSGYEGMKRTLEGCQRFLVNYKELLDSKRKRSLVASFKTVKFAYDDEIKRLRDQIQRHYFNIFFTQLNTAVKDLRPNREDTIVPAAVSPPLPIPGSSRLISPPSTPPLLGSPFLPFNGFQAPAQRSQSRGTSIRSGSAASPLLESPQEFATPNRPNWPVSNPPVPSVRDSVVSIPSTISTSHSPNRDSGYVGDIPGLVLPQSALPYTVATVYFGTKKVDLKRIIRGRDTESGRELVIIDENNNLRFRHRIKAPSSQICFPYTWHRRWCQPGQEHSALEVGFKGSSDESHSISFKGGAPVTATPTYIFTKPDDFKAFQTQLRGKHLEDTFEIRQILSALHSKAGEATDQHLKIWRDIVSGRSTISFYASAISKPRHLEFPLAGFDQAINVKEEVEICLNFVGFGEQKRGKAAKSNPSRAQTERTASSSTTISTTVPDVFSRQNTFASSIASSAPSNRASMASFQSESNRYLRERSKSESSTDLVKQMKYMKIEFSDEKEAARFKTNFDRLYQEEQYKPPDLLEWQLNTQMSSARRAESITSASPSGTPFAMSPELRPTQNR